MLIRTRGSGKSTCFFSSTGQGSPRRGPISWARRSVKAPWLSAYPLGLIRVKPAAGNSCGEPGVSLGQQRHVDVVADVGGAGAVRRGAGQPVLHEVGREPWLLVGAERVGDDELAEAQIRRGRSSSGTTGR